jgi:hypothetical protein
MCRGRPAAHASPMSKSHFVKMMAGALPLGGLTATGPVLEVATAHADDTFAPHHWCPG